MSRLYFTFLLLLVTIALSACKTNYAELPTYSGARQLQAVIEIPAGSNQKISYNPANKAFENEKLAGHDHVVQHLPYPGNYGFVPSTEVGKNGRGLSVLVLGERAETGTVKEVLPVATLMLEKPTGDLYPIVVAVPARPSEQLIKAYNYASLSLEYPEVKTILLQWFVHHNRTAPLKFIGWKDEKFAEKEIHRWMKL